MKSHGLKKATAHASPNVKNNSDGAFARDWSSNSALASSNERRVSKQSMNAEASGWKRTSLSNSNLNSRVGFVKKPKISKNECVKTSNLRSHAVAMRSALRSNNNLSHAIPNAWRSESHAFEKNTTSRSPRPLMTFHALSKPMWMLNLNTVWMKSLLPTEALEKPRFKTAWLASVMSERLNFVSNLKRSTMPRKLIGPSGLNWNSNPAKHLRERPSCRKSMQDYATSV